MFICFLFERVCYIPAAPAQPGKLLLLLLFFIYGFQLIINSSVKQSESLGRVRKQLLRTNLLNK